MDLVHSFLVQWIVKVYMDVHLTELPHSLESAVAHSAVHLCGLVQFVPSLGSYEYIVGRGMLLGRLIEWC
jgi:hypothetical protein